MKKLLTSNHVQFLVILCYFIGLNVITVQAEEVDRDQGPAAVSVLVGEDDAITEENLSPSPHNKTSFGVKGASNLSFSQVKLGGKNKAVIAGKTIQGKEIDTLGVEVADLRGSGSGWTLTAELSSLTLKGDTDGRTLEGFKLTIPTLKVTSKSSIMTEDRLPQGKEVVFIGKEKKVIFTAEKGQGMGKYTNVFDQKNSNSKKGVTLEVPLIAKKGEYQGNMTWTLIDGPV